jgi:phage terminase Nu1 subunit (DNA packaging protein)
MTRIVNKRDLSEILGISERTLTEWQREGLPVRFSGERGESNQYDTEQVIAWWIAREISKVQTETAKDRLARLQADRVQLDLDEKRGLLIPVDKIEPAWQGMVLAAKNFLRSQPARLAQLLETSEGVEAKRELISETFDEFLRKLSTYDPGSDPDTTEDLAMPGGEEIRATAQDDSGAVGGAIPVSIGGDE